MSDGKRWSVYDWNDLDQRAKVEREDGFSYLYLPPTYSHRSKECSTDHQGALWSCECAWPLQKWEETTKEENTKGNESTKNEAAAKRSLLAVFLCL
jgi:hypothetical protein